jgi:integrase
MGIKFNEIEKRYEVSYHKRHPITRQPIGRKRICNDKGQPITAKAEADRILKQLVIEVENSFQANHAQGTMTFNDLVGKFLKSLKERDLTAHTIENYDLCLNAHAVSIWGNKPVDSISTEEIRHLVKVKLADKSVSTQKTILKYIRGVFEFAVELGTLNRNPTPKMQFRIADKIKRVLTEPQLRIFLEKAKIANHEWYPIWTTAAYTGMRNGELHALTWDKVNLENRKILVSCSWNKKDGFKDLTKSGEDRIVGIAPALLVTLQELKLKSADSVFVLPRIHEWDEGRQAELLRHFLVGIGIPPVRFHDLRASWATVMLSKGVEPVKVMAMGGWKDLKTMMIYIRKAGINIEGITDRLDLHNPTLEEANILEFKNGL